MGLTIIEENETLVITDSPDASVVVVNVPDQTINVVAPEAAPVLLEVLAGAKGEPGVQNLFVGETPPSNPQEGWVWIDTSA